MMLHLRSDDTLHPSHWTVRTEDIYVNTTLSKISTLPAVIPGYGADEGIEVECPSGRAVFQEAGSGKS